MAANIFCNFFHQKFARPLCSASLVETNINAHAFVWLLYVRLINSKPVHTAYKSSTIPTLDTTLRETGFSERGYIRGNISLFGHWQLYRWIVSVNWGYHRGWGVPTFIYRSLELYFSVSLIQFCCLILFKFSRAGELGGCNCVAVEIFLPQGIFYCKDLFGWMNEQQYCRTDY